MTGEGRCGRVFIGAGVSDVTVGCLFLFLLVVVTFSALSSLQVLGSATQCWTTACRLHFPILDRGSRYC
jgi:hypothetical protein